MFLFARFIDRKDFQYVEMDTDSAYMALSGNFHSLIRRDMRNTFYSEYDNWFPRIACPEHTQEFLHQRSAGVVFLPPACCRQVTAYDKRTPGLFKDEFRGDGVVALNSKTYFCWNNILNTFKMSSKGLSKRTNKLDKDKYLGVLRSKKSVVGTNKGFQMRKNKMVTYSQLRTGLSYFYGKRVVHDDGVSTSNIHL